MSARRRLLTSAVAAVFVGGAVAPFGSWEVASLSGWITGGVGLASLLWITALRADAEGTRRIAQREDESRGTADLVVVVAALASLVGVALLLVQASSASGAALVGFTALAVAGIIVGWALVHLVFTLRYADLYFAEGRGVDFPGTDDPDYRDFLYLAFTIGMTYQVSDTDLTTRTMRRTALRHALLSYVFGTAIIAVTINVVAGLAH